MPINKQPVQVPRVWDMTASDSRDDASTRREHREIIRRREIPTASKKSIKARIRLFSDL